MTTVESGSLVAVPGSADDESLPFSRPTTRSRGRSSTLNIHSIGGEADNQNSTAANPMNLSAPLVIDFPEGLEGITGPSTPPHANIEPPTSSPSVSAPRKRNRQPHTTSSEKKCSQSKKVRTLSPQREISEQVTTALTEPDPLKFQPKQVIIGTFYADKTSYVKASDEGLVLYLTAEKNSTKSVCLPYDSFLDYMICDSPQLPIMVVRGDLPFGEKVRKTIPSLKGSDSTIMSCRVFDPRSSDNAHWYIILEMETCSNLINLMHVIMQSTLVLSESPGGSVRLNVAKTITLDEAKKKMNATKTIVLKWKELQFGSWKSKQPRDNTILISGNRIKFKANKDGQSSDVTLAIAFNEVTSLIMCIENSCPVMFIRANETFGWSARERLGISSIFKQGKDYYNSDNPETRFRYVTFKLEKENLSQSMWQHLLNLSEMRLSALQLIDSREAKEMVHNLLYQPIKCDSVRVGANEIDELRAVTIYSDSLYICGCMLDSVVTMHLCLGDISEIIFCTNDKLPVMFIKTSTAIRDTLKKNMAGRSADVYFDPTSQDMRTQYIVFELAKATTKETIDLIAKTLQCILSNFADRPSVCKEGRATQVKSLTKKKSLALLKSIKEPLKTPDCECGKKVDWKRKEEVKQYVQSMVQKHGCDALEKMANRVVDLEKKIMCSVCLDNDCQVVFSCGHMICVNCDLNLRKCHICRLKILRRVRIFI